MKKISFLVALIFFGVHLSAQDKKEVIKLSEPIVVTETYELYGDKIDTYETPRTLNETLSSDKENSSVVIKTSIKEVCEKKGCFFIAQEGDNAVRITFKDYGFFIPTDSQGKEVIIIGELTKKTLSEEQAKHYAEDAGKNSESIKGEQEEYSIVASTIILYKEKPKN